MNGVSALIHVPQPFLPHEDIVRSQHSTNWKAAFPRTNHAWHPDFGLSASKSMRNKFLFFISHTVCGICYGSPNRLRLSRESLENQDLKMGKNQTAPHKHGILETLTLANEPLGACF